MEIWLDSANREMIQKALKLGLLSGITTNPSIIAQAQRPLDDLLEDLLHYQEGLIAVQVDEADVFEMVQQGQTLYSFSKRFIVKVPVTQKGLEAIYLLSRQGIPTMATAIFHAHQALMAALTGAKYVAPYLSQIEKMGGDPWSELKTMVQTFQNYQLDTKIIGASLKSIDHVMKCALAGIHGITIKDQIFEELIADQPLTAQALQVFANSQLSAEISQKI